MAFTRSASAQVRADRAGAAPGAPSIAGSRVDSGSREWSATPSRSGRLDREVSVDMADRLPTGDRTPAGPTARGGGAVAPLSADDCSRCDMAPFALHAGPFVQSGGAS